LSIKRQYITATTNTSNSSEVSLEEEQLLILTSIVAFPPKFKETKEIEKEALLKIFDQKVKKL